ncbi:unnamed protein product [Effrenium voratum]|nr:unnamed protein product [Effrenium voratum]
MPAMSKIALFSAGAAGAAFVVPREQTARLRGGGRANLRPQVGSSLLFGAGVAGVAGLAASLTTTHPRTSVVRCAYDASKM